MTDYRENKVTGQLVILSSRRSARPGEKKEEKPKCPFCYGNESMTPPESYRWGEGNHNEQGWKIRVVPNKFQITEIHEVIVHSPDHGLDLQDLPDEHVIKILETYQQRYNLYQNQGQVVIFNNTGREAGESLEHAHSQLAVVPSGFPIKSNILSSVLEDIAYQNSQYSVLCPRTSEWSYETIIVPNKRNRTFGELENEELASLALILKNVLLAIQKEVGRFPYNYYIYPGVDCYIRITPRMIRRAGFEEATGIFVNTKNPLEVLELMKKSLNLG